VLYAELLIADPGSIERPTLGDPIELAIAASIVELIAARLNKSPPAWTRDVHALRTPYALVTIKLSSKLARLQRETPPQLRFRNLIAPENFLTSA
jgi:hypothetical protein